MFASAEPVPPKSFDDTPFSWVTTPEEFAIMLEKLRGAKEIAIDLEYHSYRSFYGFVCLMQISTRREDWVVDTLQLRDELEELNEVFTDPNVVKVRPSTTSGTVVLTANIRCSTVPKAISSGCNKISICTSSTSSIRIMPQRF